MLVAAFNKNVVYLETCKIIVNKIQITMDKL